MSKKLPQYMIDQLVSRAGQGKGSWDNYNEDYRYWYYLKSLTEPNVNLMDKSDLPSPPDVNDYPQ